MTALLKLVGFGVLRGEAPVVAGVDLELGSQDILALVGRNGSGKTSLLEGLAGLHVTRGVALLDGQPLGAGTQARLAAGIALCPEGRALFPDMSTWDNLLLGGYLLPPLVATTRARALAERFPVVSERRRQRAGSLSGGEQQVLAVCRCLMSGPRVLLLDSPTSGLAPHNRDVIADLVRAVADEPGHAVVVADDNMPFALGMATRVLALVGGQPRFVAAHALSPQEVSARLLEAEQRGTMTRAEDHA